MRSDSNCRRKNLQRVDRDSSPYTVYQNHDARHNQNE